MTNKEIFGVDCISRKEVFETIDDCNSDGLKGIFCSYNDGERFKEYIKNLPPVTPHFSSGLVKNSKKLEKDFGELDCISRQAVLELIADDDLSMGQVVRGIHALLPVTPQTRKGHWISHREHCEKLGAIPSGLGAYAWCSECDCAIDVGEWHRNRYNYCPNCGADMRGKK